MDFGAWGSDGWTNRYSLKCRLLNDDKLLCKAWRVEQTDSKTGKSLKFKDYFLGFYKENP